MSLLFVVVWVNTYRTLLLEIGSLALALLFLRLSLLDLLRW
jgi:hypothetical protein